MTEKEAKEKLVNWVNDQVGYKEGENNYNKYAQMALKMIGWNAQNQPWCSVFVAAAFGECFGDENGSKMLCATVGTVSAAVATNYSAYLAAGRFFYNNPQVGDQVFYNNFNHTGIITEVNGNQLVAVDGNYSDGVTRRNLTLSGSGICGYGRPRWNIVANVSTAADDSSSVSTDDATGEDDDSGFENGDLVEVSPNAVWYTGQKVASMVFQHRWYVLSQFNDRVVINESDDGNYHIMSPIAAKYLTLVKSASDVKTALEEVDSYMPEESNDEVIDSASTTSGSSEHIIVQADETPSSMLLKTANLGQKLFYKIFNIK